MVIAASMAASGLYSATRVMGTAMLPVGPFTAHDTKRCESEM